MTYEFECTACHKHEDKQMTVQEYSDTKDKIICSCGGKMQRVYTPVLGTEYKCRGFYDTDVRLQTSR